MKTHLFLFIICFTALPLFSQTSPIRVAIYEDSGAGKRGTNNVELSLADGNLYTTRVINADDVRAGILSKFDVLVQPGGSGSKQAKTLEVSGVDSIRDFIKRGGGYLGICAGAYLSTNFYSWSLGILNAWVVDREHWNRGSGDVVLQLTPEGKEFFGIPEDTIVVQYNQGPLMTPGVSSNVADYTVLGRFKTEIAENGAPAGVMIGTDAIAMGEYGSGRVISISPHFEKRAEQRYIISKAVTWLAHKKAK
jgi:hypothetical protein